jgi:hypothetical protein
MCLNQKSERLSAAVLVLLKRSWTVVFVMLLLFGSTLPLAAAATPKSSCPTTGKTVFVVMVDSNPKSAAVGTSVVTTVAVSDSNVNVTPFALSPETISFRWVSTAGEKIVKNAPVVPTGSTGIYTYTQTVGDDFPTGTVTIFVVACSCSDGQGNYGPPMDVNSDSSIHEKDGSSVEIGATMQQPATQDLLAAYGVPIVIAIVVILAVLLLVFRTRKKKK